jgi:hypothetical protein
MIKPWFLTEGKLAAILIKPSLGLSNWPVILLHPQTQSSFLAPFITAPSPASTDDDDRGIEGSDDRNAIMDFYAPETPSEEDPEEVVPHVSGNE